MKTISSDFPLSGCPATCYMLPLCPRQAAADHSCLLCRFDTDQTFSSLQGTTLDTMNVVDGTWYVYLKGDYAGRVSGAVYDLRNSSDPVKLVTTVRCKCVLALSSLFSLSGAACTVEAYMLHRLTDGFATTSQLVLFCPSESRVCLPDALCKPCTT